jgi:7-carboxy-7-deazaguanine synthase
MKGAGANVDDRLEQTLTVTEIFRSIQGESTWAGCPCVFVRLAGCNLRCAYCDTQYAYEGGELMTVGEILHRCESFPGSLVEVTGGEPLLQEGCQALAECLLETGRTVLIETNGSLPISRLPRDAIKIMDLKCPSSGAAGSNDWRNIDSLSPRDEMKFVIADRADYEWSRDVVARYDLSRRCRAVLFSPAFGVLEPRRLAAWVLEDALPVRVHLQLHRYIWPETERGV